MNRLKALLFIFTATSLLPLHGLGLDLGLITDSQSTLDLSAEWSASQRNTQRLWAQFESAGFVFRTQARVATGLTLPSPAFSLDPDLEMLKFQWSVKNLQGLLTETEIQAGRFSVRDPAQLIFSSAWDGLLLTLGSPAWQTRMGFGYNGFLAKSSSTLVLTQSDITDQSNSQVFFAAPRATGLVEGTVNWGQVHKVSLTYLPQLDLRKFFIGQDRILVEAGSTEENKVEGGVLNTHHGLLTFTGQFVSGFYYTLAGGILAGQTLYFNNSYQEAAMFGTAGTLGLDWFLKDSLSSVLHLQGWYTSGDDSSRQEYREGAGNTGSPERLEMFKTLSNTAPGFIFAPQWGNLAVGESSYSFKVLSSPRVQDGLTTTLTGRSFFRPKIGPLSSSRILKDSGSHYLGSEAVISLRYRPLSDLSLSATAGMFFPNLSESGTFNSEDARIDSKFALYFSLSL